MMIPGTAGLRPTDPKAAEAARPEPLAEADRATREAAMRKAAVAFEATFLAEMLKHAGAGQSTPGFDGGVGEDAFAQELVAAQAKELAKAGGIGLADKLFEAMLAREGEA